MARKIGGTASAASFIGSHVRPQISAMSPKAAMRVALPPKIIRCS